jgi:hypothetical protein
MFRLPNLYKREHRVTPRLARAPTIEPSIRMAALSPVDANNPCGDLP